MEGLQEVLEIRKLLDEYMSKACKKGYELTASEIILLEALKRDIEFIVKNF